MHSVFLLLSIVDLFVLRDFTLLTNSPSWVKNKDTTMTFRASVTCSAADCSALVANVENFEFKYYLDWDTGIQDDEQFLEALSTVALIGSGFRSDLTLVSFA